MPKAWTRGLERRCDHGPNAHKLCIGKNIKGVSCARESARYLPGQARALAEAIEIARVEQPDAPS